MAKIKKIYKGNDINRFRGDILKSYKLPILFFCTLLLVLPFAFSVPPLPFSPFGTVTYNGAPVPDGFTVESFINNVKYGGTSSTISGFYAHTVPGDDPDTGAKDGGVDGDKVLFKINGKIAKPNLTWSSGDNGQYNLIVQTCPDGILDAGEDCDDGNTVNGDGCTANCSFEYPNGSVDCYLTSKQLFIDWGIPATPPESVITTGLSKIERQNPTNPSGLQTIDTEMLSMDLTGSSPIVGPVRVRESPSRTSSGRIDQTNPSQAYPADSFFDVFVEIDSGMGTKHNDAPQRDQGNANDIPYAPNDHIDSQNQVQLLDETNNPSGMLIGEQIIFNNPTSCPVCGNAQIEFGEECETNADCNDNNPNTTDTCNSCLCSNVDLAVCGDGNIDAGEGCDDGNTNSGDGCSSTCVVEFCGDGITQAGLGEQCDDGANNGNVCVPGYGTSCDYCDAQCQTQTVQGDFCGDTVVNGPESCELPNTNNNVNCAQSTSQCSGNKTQTRDSLGNCDGNCGCTVDAFGVAQCVEASCNAQCDTNADCDDQNINTIDTCNLNSCGCEFRPANCGDGIVEGIEECDDANLINNDACKNDCTNNICGDGFTNVGVEDCDDDGNNGIPCNPSYGTSCIYCDANCNNVSVQGDFCGDNIVNGPEACELPNTNNNANCPQSTQNCVGTKLQTRDGLGNCNNGCGCVNDGFGTAQCVAGQCGAICSVNTDCDDSNTSTSDTCNANCGCDYANLCTDLDNSPCQPECETNGLTWTNNGGQLNCCGDDSGEDSPYQAAELWCDANDNDCNGVVDDGYDIGQACSAGIGECLRTGTMECDSLSSSSCNAVPGTPTSEVCDGKDNDCDTQTDESLTPEPCENQLGVCAGSVKVCGGTSGWLPCGAANYGPNYQTPETSCFDGLDNDCDGLTDANDVDCQTCQNGQRRACGVTDVGECQLGEQRCRQGRWQPCVGNIDPTTEVCDGLDNDCDGFTDEDNVCGSCGDGVVNPGEQCDENGNNGVPCNPGYGTSCTWCSVNCTNVTEQGPYCGDGLIYPPFEECEFDGDCDDSNATTTDTCRDCACNNVRQTVCGDGIVEGIEECDDANANNNDACKNDCTNNVCGDGFIYTGVEQCETNADCDDLDPTTSDACNNCNCQYTDLCTDLDNTPCQNDCQNSGFTWSNNGGQLNCCGDDNGEDSPYQAAELWCDGQDNDCNGVVDDGYNVGASCSAGVGECLRFGNIECTSLTSSGCNAVPGTPTAEVCDGKDNDCDGSTDEGLDCGPCQNNAVRPCGATDVGECQFGTQKCRRGVWGNCNGEIGPTTEICDGKDNDCDGSTDEGGVCGNCGNGIIEGAEQCDDGANNGVPCNPGYGTSCNYCDTNCRTQTVQGDFCGDNIVNGPETCELPNTNNNVNCVQSTTQCSGTKTQTRDNFGNCNGNCGCVNDSFGTAQCVKNSCGAQCAVNADCDDSNPTTTDTCNTNTCGCSNTPQVCGNGIVEGNEQCDDGNANNNDACKNDCTNNVCGDNVIYTGFEQCELPNTNNNVNCAQSTENCVGTKLQTRDGFGNCNGNCGCALDAFGAAACVKNKCGATCAVNADCNDNNASTTDTCNLNTCGCSNTPTQVCGNGVKEGTEQCDDGNLNNNDACKNDCTNNICGDNYIYTGVEKCELPNTNNNVNCAQSTENCVGTVGTKLQTRDGFGSCNNVCGCVNDTFGAAACVKNKCGATCAVNADCNDNNAATTDTCNLNNCGCEHTSSARLYQADKNLARVYKINIATFTNSYFNTLTSFPNGLTFDGTYLWMADTDTDRIYKINKDTGAIISSFAGPGPFITDLAWDGTYLWAVDSLFDKIYKLSTIGSKLATYSTPGPVAQGITYDGGYLYISDSSTDKVYKVSTSGLVISSFNAPGFESRGLASDGTYLWLADGSASPKIYKLTKTGSLVSTNSNPSSAPGGLAYGSS